jgi:hypothetical protein
MKASNDRITSEGAASAEANSKAFWHTSASAIKYFRRVKLWVVLTSSSISKTEPIGMPPPISTGTKNEDGERKKL